MLKLPTRKNFVIGLGTALSCLATLGLSAPASAAYPDKPITVVIGWGPGGGIDSFVRTVGKHIKKHLGVEFKIIYKKGGGGKVAHNLLVTKYKTDGYTIAAANVPHQTIPTQLSKKGYRLNDIQWVSNMVLLPSTIMVKKTAPFKTFGALTKAARMAPGKLKAGTPGATSGSAAFHYNWTRLAAANITLIPYRGGSKMLKGMLGNEVEVMSSNANWGVRFPDKLITVAVAGEKRYELLPDAPTLKELGINYVDNLTRTFTASAKVDKAKIKVLSDAFGKLTKDPAYVKDMKKVGLVPNHMDSAATTAYVNNYVSKNQAVFALMRSKQKKKKKK
jgi:tripartite-type tricarboxylate transporter receptor subunit TctC